MWICFVGWKIDVVHEVMAGWGNVAHKGIRWLERE